MSNTSTEIQCLKDLLQGSEERVEQFTKELQNAQQRIQFLENRISQKEEKSRTTRDELDTQTNINTMLLHEIDSLRKSIQEHQLCLQDAAMMKDEVWSFLDIVKRNPKYLECYQEGSYITPTKEQIKEFAISLQQQQQQHSRRGAPSSRSNSPFLSSSSSAHHQARGVIQMQQQTTTATTPATAMATNALPLPSTTPMRWLRKKNTTTTSSEIHRPVAMKHSTSGGSQRTTTTTTTTSKRSSTSTPMRSSSNHMTPHSNPIPLPHSNNNNNKKITASQESTTRDNSDALTQTNVTTNSNATATAANTATSKRSVSPFMTALSMRRASNPLVLEAPPVIKESIVAASGASNPITPLH